MIPKVRLNNGQLMPVIGLGTWLSKPNEVTQAVKDAIDVGYRHIDCAYFYENEKDIGAGVKQKIRDGVVKREDLFITSKLWSTFHRKDLVIPACKKSVENLDLEYLDLFLIHSPAAFKEGGSLMPEDKDGKIQFSDVDYVEVWKQLEECVKLGLTKSIGVSNFNSQQIERLCSNANIKPVNNQVECNPNINQKKLIKFCKERGVVITAFSPLGAPGFEETLPGTPSIEHPRVIEIGKKYGKTAAQVVLRYLIQNEAYPLPKTVKKTRLVENISVFDFELTKEDMDFIDTLNTGYRVYPYPESIEHKYYPFNIEY